MKTMNKAFIGALALLSSNFAFANDGLDGSLSVGGNAIADIFMKAPFEFILLAIIAYVGRKLFLK